MEGNSYKSMRKWLIITNWEKELNDNSLKQHKLPRNTWKVFFASNKKIQIKFFSFSAYQLEKGKKYSPYPVLLKS